MGGEHSGKRYYYTIKGLHPEKGTFDFSIELDPAFGKAAREHPLDKTRFPEIISSFLELYKRRETQGKEIKKAKDDFSFVSGSSLLGHVRVPGKDAVISLEQPTLFKGPNDESVRYAATQVKDAQEAHILLALWTSYASYLEFVDTLPKLHKDEQGSLGTYHYKVEGLLPRTDIDMSRFNFGIYLKTEFGKQAAAIPLSEQWHEQLQQEGIALLRASDPKTSMKYVRKTHNFGEWESLLQWIGVPGNACDLGIAGSDFEFLGREFAQPHDFESGIEYGPHNIDTSYQAYGLLALWNLWYEKVAEEIAQHGPAEKKT